VANSVGRRNIKESSGPIAGYSRLMATRSSKLLIVVHPGGSRRRLPEVLRWLRALVPTAVLLVAPVKLPDADDAEVIQLDCSESLDGPLAVASLLARNLPS
jgi:hypothetical protein